MEILTAKTRNIAFARLAEDNELLTSVTQVAEKAKITAGFFFLIGTLKKARLGFFHEGNYETMEMDQPLEIVSCLGNISIKEGKVFAHAHIAVSDKKAQVFGGHVMPECIIGVTGELVLVEASGVKLVREFDEKTKLSLLTFLRPQRARARKGRRPT